MSIQKTLITAILLLPFQVIAAIENNEVTELSLEQLMNIEVFTASRFTQNIKEAPSAVTVITADDVKKYGYRTLTDIMNSIRGLYSSYDRNYTYIGARGFSITGDYNSRILVLLDGNRVNENIYDGAGAGYDAIVNVDLIKRVEFAPGPGSAVYGANALFGVFNIITKNADDIDGIQASTDYGSENSRRLRVTLGKGFENGVQAVFSASNYKSDGADLYFAEFDDPTNNFGVAENLDYEESRNLFAKLQWSNWQLEVAYNDRIKGIPTASYEQEFNMEPSETIDSVLLVSLNNETEFNNGARLSSSLSFGDYEYDGDFIYDYPPITVNKDEVEGHWLGLESHYQTTLFDKHKLLIGAEYRNNIKQDQANFDAAPLFESYLDDKRDSSNYGLFIQDEIRLSDRLLLNIGLRHDTTDFGKATDSNTRQNSTNPRIALICDLQDETTLKLIYGTAFRNPNAYELYYGEALGYLPNTELKPEEITSYELDLEHYFSNNFKLTAALFHNEISNLIGQNSDIDGNVFFDNINMVDATGAELEAEYINYSGIRVRSSYSYVNAEDATTGTRLTNSPQQLAKLNMVLPVYQNMADLGLEFQYTGDRTTTSGLADVGGFGVTNLTLFSDKVADHLELSASIYNVFDKTYADPASDEHTQNSIQQDGRVYRIKASYTF